MRSTSIYQSVVKLSSHKNDCQDLCVVHDKLEHKDVVGKEPTGFEPRTVDNI